LRPGEFVDRQSRENDMDSMHDTTKCPQAYLEPESPYRRRLIATGASAALLAGVAGCSAARPSKTTGLARGIVWQVDEAHLDPHGDWDRLGATDLLVQWSAVDGVSFLPGTATQHKIVSVGLDTSKRLPDWTRIASEPWARNVILGLAGRFDESAARTQIAKLIAQSKELAAVRPPVHVSGYYFPVEVDPSWQGAAALAPLLQQLPRPLWISVYDNSNIGGAPLASWLGSWLPQQVGVFLQDGCGVYARGPVAARSYADALADRLGKERVRVIAEAFRPIHGGGFRAASAAELAPQLLAYRDYRVYLFDGPHYVSAQLVAELKRVTGF
jgi:hypothetical protein